MPKTSFDPDAQAFITAAGITDPTQQSAINTLVVNLKGYNIWTKMKAIYPIVGGSAATHKFNLKDPRDLDAAFRLQFSTGWTHSSTGMTPNGTAFADTYLTASTSLSLNSSHISYYSRTNIDELKYDMGSATDPNRYITIALRQAGSFRSLINDGTTDLISNSDSKGFYIGNRTASNIKNGWKNGTKVINVATASGALDTRKIYLGALNAGYAAFPSTKQCAFSSIGDGLTDTEATNFYTAVQAYQTTLGRQV